MQRTTTTTTNQTTDNAIKLLGEAFVPGASLLMDGQVASGALHAVIGTWARVALGPLGPLGLALVVANSFSKSATGKNLVKQFTREKSDKTETETKVETETKTKSSRAKS